MSVVGWGGVGHAAGASYVSVTELIGQALQLVCCELIVVPQHMVMGGAAGTLRRALNRTQGIIIVGRALSIQNIQPREPKGEY